MDEQYGGSGFLAGLTGAAALLGAVVGWIVKPGRWQNDAKVDTIAGAVGEHGRILREDHVHRGEFDELRRDHDEVARRQAAVVAGSQDVLRRLDNLERQK